MQAPVSLIKPPCALCGGTDFITELRGARDWVWHKPGRFQIQRCQACALVQTRPRPADDAIGFYYEDAYSGESEGGMRDFQTENWLGRLVNSYRMRTIAKVRPFGPTDHVLDVGCSYGGFLKLARDTTGCQTSGIDLDAGSIERAIDRDKTDFKVGLLTEADYPPESFQVITFFESLEHHTDPVAALKAAHDALEPGGYCVVEVPHWNGLWRRVFRTAWLPLLMPQHLFHFTEKTLQKSFEAAGLRVIRHQTMFYPLEGVASFWLWLVRVLRMPPPGKLNWTAIYGIPLLLLMLPLYFVVEIPSQLILQIFGATGHQLAVAQRPEAIEESSDGVE